MMPGLVALVGLAFGNTQGVTKAGGVFDASSNIRAYECILNTGMVLRLSNAYIFIFFKYIEFGIWILNNEC